MSDLVLLQRRRTGGRPDPAERIRVTIGGRTFTAGRRTYAHLLWTVARLAKLHPGARLVILQPCYNIGVELSKGTHDGDGVLDVEIVGLPWLEGQRFLRAHGWAAWWRHTGTWADPSDWHHHMISLGCPGPVGIFVPGQVLDYYNAAQGLKGQHNSGSDPTWPNGDDETINLSYFDYPRWLRDQEDDMPYRKWDQADKDALANDVAAEVAPIVVQQLMGAFVDGSKTTVRAALRRASNAARAHLGKRADDGGDPS